jgi:hypothetical protein
MWSESVLLFLFGEGNVTHPDFRCDLETSPERMDGVSICVLEDSRVLISSVGP